MSKRKEVIARMKARLDEVKEELHRLEQKIGLEARETSRKTLDELHEKRVTAESRIEELDEAGEEGWEHMKDEAEKTWKAFKAGVDTFRDFSDHA